jgi:pentatricopeptide repeat domain-containing protein 2
MEEKFKEKMKEFAFADSKNMIFTEDLKNIVHLAEQKPADFTLVHQMLKKFNQQNKHLRFGNFVFGPVVMRMYHFLNEPNQALAAFKDEELDGMFDQITTMQVLGDLLYRNGMYQEVLDVLEIAKKKQVQGFKYPRNITVLALASCWKMNTLQSYEYALQVLNDLKEIGAETTRRGVTFGAALAIEQNAPSVAVEILSLAKKPNYFTVKNLKVAALADLGRPDDAFPILRHSIEYDDPAVERKPSFCKDVLQKLAASVDRVGNKEISLEFEKIQKALAEVGLVSDDSIQVALESEIEYSPNKPGSNQQRYQRDTMGKNFRAGPNMSLTPRRNPVYIRERQSIKHEY